MRELSPTGRQRVQDLAQRHQFSGEAVLNMLGALVNGNGTMAQFSHPEFSGSGQWMRGGMIMVSDMFNADLKRRIDELCNELAALVVGQPDLLRGSNFESPPQGRSAGAASLFVAPPGGPTDDWWGADLGRPNSTGAENGVRYAYFANARRLAIDVDGQVAVYDTLDHRIGGFSQQQSAGGTLSFNSQHGLIDVASLPVTSADGQSAEIAAAQPSASPADKTLASAPTPSSNDVLSTIERLAELRAKGVISDAELNTKKAELLSRL